MSLVGPRPELPQYVELYSPEQREVLELQPGMTDPASIAMIDEGESLAAASDLQQYYQEVALPEKLAINLAYARRATVFSDLGVILRTLVAIVFRR